MADKGGQSTQAGIDYQNKIAALFMGRMISLDPRPEDKEIIAVRNEDPTAEVDDVVLSYRDHREWMQVKLSMAASGDAWIKFWKHLFAQKWDHDFGKFDKLVLVISQSPDWVKDLNEICRRASSSHQLPELATLEAQVAEWQGRLSQKQQKFLQDLVDSLRADQKDDRVRDENLQTQALFELFGCLEVWTHFNADTIEDDFGASFMPKANMDWFNLFDVLFKIAGDHARYGKSISKTELINELKKKKIVIFPGTVEKTVPVEWLPRAQNFKNRKEQLATLISVLQPGAVVEICGPAGMGKTALAAELLYELTTEKHIPPSNFPDGVITHSFYKQADAKLALKHILDSYALEAMSNPTEAVQKLLANKQALLVLDGAERIQDLKSLLEIHGCCAVLITSQRREAQPILLELFPLDETESIGLLKDWSATSANDQSDEKRICDLVGMLPMAIVLAGSQIKESQQTAEEFADWLEMSPLDALDHGERSMESVPVLLERSLSQVSDAARLAMMAIGLLAPASFKRDWVTQALNISEEASMRAFGELSRNSLIKREDTGMYQVSHSLLYTYVEKQGQSMLGILLEPFCVTFERQIAQVRKRGNENNEELDRLHPHALVIMTRLAQAGMWETGEGLAILLDDYLEFAGYSSERLRLAQIGIDGAKQIGDRREEGNWLGTKGLAFLSSGQMQNAVDHFEQALAIAEETKDRGRQGNWLGNLGSAYWQLGRADEAISCYEQAIAIARETGDRSREEKWLGNLGLVYMETRQVEQAIIYYEQALVIGREIGDRRGAGNQLGNLGNAYSDLGDAEQAIGYYEQAQRIAREIGDRRGEGNQLGNLGSAYSDLGQVLKAIDYYEQALNIQTEIGDRRGEGNQLSNLGSAYLNLGQVEQAIGYYEQALAIYKEIGDRRNEVTSLGNLGSAYKDLGQVEQAIGYYEQALVIHREIGDRRGEGNQMGNLGDAFLGQGKAEQAIGYFEQALVIHREIGDRRGQGNQLGNLGNAYLNLGQVEQAIEYYEQALSIDREIGDRNREGADLANLGWAYVDQGKREQACDAWHRALKIYEEIKSPRAETIRGWL